VPEFKNGPVDPVEDAEHGRLLGQAIVDGDPRVVGVGEDTRVREVGRYAVGDAGQDRIGHGPPF
jgi:hypothetical protein